MCFSKKNVENNAESDKKKWLLDTIGYKMPSMIRFLFLGGNVLCISAHFILERTPDKIIVFQLIFYVNHQLVMY